MEKSESESFLENTIQLHYSIEANRSVDVESRNKPAKTFKWKKKTRKTVNMQYMTF